MRLGSFAEEGQGPGLSDLELGAKRGQETVKLLLEEIPSYNHAATSVQLKGTPPQVFLFAVTKSATDSAASYGDYLAFQKHSRTRNPLVDFVLQLTTEKGSVSELVYMVGVTISSVGSVVKKECALVEFCVFEDDDTIKKSLLSSL